MIIDILENAEKYYSINPRFAAAFRYLKTPAAVELGTGRKELEGDKLYAVGSQKTGKKKEDAKLEMHKRYIDIQFVLKGIDSMGWRPVRNCSNINSPYDEEKDIAFFDDEPFIWSGVPPGAFAIFFPEDAHAPMVSNAEIHKVILKVAVEGRKAGS